MPPRAARLYALLKASGVQEAQRAGDVARHGAPRGVRERQPRRRRLQRALQRVRQVLQQQRGARRQKHAKQLPERRGARGVEAVQRLPRRLQAAEHLKLLQHCQGGILLRRRHRLLDDVLAAVQRHHAHAAHRAVGAAPQLAPDRELLPLAHEPALARLLRQQLGCVERAGRRRGGVQQRCRVRRETPHDARLRLRHRGAWLLHTTGGWSALRTRLHSPRGGCDAAHREGTAGV